MQAEVPEGAAAVESEERLVDEDGRVRESVQLRNGVPHGLTQQYGPDGQVQLKGTFENGQLQGPVFLYGADGELIQKAEYAAGVQHGEMVIYAAGRPQARMQFRDGVQHGPAMTYGPDGAMLSNVAWAAGRRAGKAEYFAPGGRLVRSEEYVNDLLEGVVIEYHTSGAVRQKSMYAAARLHGEQVTMDESGRVLQRVTFHEGVPVAAPRPTAAARKKAAKKKQQQPPSLLKRLVARVKGGA